MMYPSRVQWRWPKILLSLTLLYTGCAPQLYTGAELKSDAKLESELIHKKVEVWKHDNQRIFGRVQAVQNDSLVIVKKDSRVTLPISEVRSLIVIKNDDLVAGTMLTAALLTTLILIIVSVSAFQVPS